MDPDEISVVLQRASELHAKISDAIARALKSEFLLTTKGDGASGGGSGSPGAEISPRGNGDELSGEVNVEAKSLSGIRDALETLEEQLECLQTLQYQQRAEKDAALAELEESRRILLNRLRNHRGKEWEVVHEALAFAGEPVEDRDDLPLPPYAMPLPEPRSNSDQRSGSFGREPTLYNSSTVEASDHSSATKQRDGQHHQGGDRVGLFRLPFKLDLGGLAGRLFGPGMGVTSKAAIIVASVITIILFSELGARKESRRTKSRKHSTAAVEAAASTTTAVAPAAASTAAPAPCPRPSDFEERCPPGKVMIIQDGLPKCVVKERIEIPFHPGVGSPDVLYGRG